MSEKTILVVDDEVSIIDMLKEIFTMNGYKVVTAESAEKALEILANQSIMVMFLDLKLPGMSGIELCKKIRKDNLIAIIHAFTGYVNLYGLIDCRAAGFDDFFVKPVDTNLLLEAAEHAFKKIARWKLEEYEVT